MRTKTTDHKTTEYRVNTNNLYVKKCCESQLSVWHYIKFKYKEVESIIITEIWNLFIYYSVCYMVENLFNLATFKYKMVQIARQHVFNHYNKFT